MTRTPRTTLILASGLALLAAGAADPPRGKTPLSEPQLKRLAEAIKPYHARYDHQAALLSGPYHSPGYHTTLRGGTVHDIRESLTYAVALLDTGDEGLKPRAEAVLRKAMSLQDQDPASKTYGIWPYFLEEPLAKMAPPDWNWADFCGVQLLQVALDHRDRLSPEVRRLLDDSIWHAAESIERRDVGPAYTNIAIMGTYVTLAAAELYGKEPCRAYALGRLRRFYDYTRAQGSFTEYNSPTYTWVAAVELARLRWQTRDPGARRVADELYTMAWTEMATHYHPPTRQWAGPHSRTYRTLLGGDTLGLLRVATGGRVDIGDDRPTITEHRPPVTCPEPLLPYFTSLPSPRDVVRVYLKAAPPVIGTTRLEEAFALGSVNRGDLWEQRRALVAYWGKPGRPSSLSVRFLHDGRDFADAQFFSAQRGGDVLAAVNFGTDGGDTHISIDRLKGGVVRAKDFRLRFEFGGEAGRVAPPVPREPTAPTRFALEGVNLGLVVPYATFDAGPARWESGAGGGVAWLDVVVYQGPERDFRLASIDQAAVGLALRFSTGEAPPPAVNTSARGGRLGMTFGPLGLSVPLRPDSVKALQQSVRYGD